MRCKKFSAYARCARVGAYNEEKLAVLRLRELLRGLLQAVTPRETDMSNVRYACGGALVDLVAGSAFRIAQALQLGLLRAERISRSHVAAVSSVC